MSHKSVVKIRMHVQPIDALCKIVFSTSCVCVSNEQTQGVQTQGVAQTQQLVPNTYLSLTLVLLVILTLFAPESLILTIPALILAVKGASDYILVV